MTAVGQSVLTVGLSFPARPNCRTSSASVAASQKCTIASIPPRAGDFRSSPMSRRFQCASAAVETSKNRLSRDFRSLSIFDFCNGICREPTSQRLDRQKRRLPIRRPSSPKFAEKISILWRWRFWKGSEHTYFQIASFPNVRRRPKSLEIHWLARAVLASEMELASCNQDVGA
jgi:hypothetical protein